MHNIVTNGEGISLNGQQVAHSGILNKFSDRGLLEEWGLKWTASSQLFGETHIQCVCNVENGIVLAGTRPNGKIIRSTDSGLNWTDLGQQGSEIWVNTICYLGNGICLAGTSNGAKVYRSTDYGLTWAVAVDLNNLYSETSITDIIYLGNGICLLASYSSSRIYRSTDYGQTWTQIGQVSTGLHLLTYVGNGIVLGSTLLSGHIVRSTDYGLNWTDLGQIGNIIDMDAIEYIGNGICLAGGWISSGVDVDSIFRSTDYGATWTEVSLPSAVNVIWSFCHLGNGIVIAGAGDDTLVYRSTDYGLTWTDLGITDGGYAYIDGLANLNNGIVLGAGFGTGKIYRSTLGEPVDIQDLVTKKHTQDTDTKIIVGDTSVEITDTDSDGKISCKADNAEKLSITKDGIVIGGSTNKASFDSDGILTLAGTARVIKYTWIHAGGIRAAGVNGATEGLNDNGFIVLSFADSQEKYAQANIKVPDDMDLSADAYICIGWSSPTISQNCDWEITYLLTKVGDTTEAAGTTVQDYVASSSTANGLVISPIVTIAGGTITTEKCIHVKIMRDGNDGNDNLGDIAELHGAALMYTANKLGE